MKGKILGVILFVTSTLASTINIQKGEVYRGDETYNNEYTGESCYIQVDEVKKNTKGMHCFDITWRYLSTSKDIKNESLTSSSRITNIFRPEYPRLKTCAVNLDGTVFGKDIYGEDTQSIFNRVFTGMHMADKNQLDYILSFSPDSKTLDSASYHILTKNRMKWYRCVNLRIE